MARNPQVGVGYLPRLLAPDVTWDDLRWLGTIWPRTLIPKGVLNVADARRAADPRRAGIVPSTHGGRQLDGCGTE